MCERKIEAEAVESCPYCEHENTYPNWNVDKQGYVVKCQNCGKTVFLCDECLHHYDNPNGSCNWHLEYLNLRTLGVCKRGVCTELEVKI